VHRPVEKCPHSAYPHFNLATNCRRYHIGLRYTGDARCLLNLHLKASAFGTNIPVGVYDLDVDAELWVKIRLAPIAPYVGTVSLAFVRLPTIKLVLAPFRLVNLFAIPFLSRSVGTLVLNVVSARLANELPGGDFSEWPSLNFPERL
jgi:hypothetical protein